MIATNAVPAGRLDAPTRAAMATLRGTSRGRSTSVVAAARVAQALAAEPGVTMANSEPGGPAELPPMNRSRGARAVLAARVERSLSSDRHLTTNTYEPALVEETIP